MIQINSLKGRNKDTDVDSDKYPWNKAGNRKVANWEIGTDIYTIPCIK